VTFSVLGGTSIVSHDIDSMTFFRLGNDEKQASQVSDTVMIVTKFVTKKHLIAEDLL
jgi:hypothetical protein